MNDTVIVITLLVLIASTILSSLYIIWSLSYQMIHVLSRLASSVERIAEVELPVLSAAVVDAENYPQTLDICNPN